ncbi:response regulator transcription factor [Flavihumibacter solisilvae]|uniref:Transcriptional regulator n=1 Tax=Flavihumibacter solisilvae TaxID=1349421 RepID=A0A0C1L4C5_9BACT|nr:response regulator transcription factor [Flavihumibacter solisilvae]KIC94967.1 transcriptional regulator [Flavihumibacter solisilvae]
MERILLVEDDMTLSANIRDALSAEGFYVESAYDGLLAEKLLRKQEYDCIILDINLPGKTGYAICKDFRKINLVTPVIMLTAFNELEDKIQGYDSGADDYLTKPFYTRELLLRVQALLKRSKFNGADKANPKITAGDIVIDRSTSKVTRQGTEINLTPREYQILVKLVSSNGELVSKKELIREIWGVALDSNSNTIEVYINFLRKKLDKPFGKDSIKTKIGFGYYFDEH